jgi:hypothetical protein
MPNNTTSEHCLDDLPIRPSLYSISLLQPVIRLDRAAPLFSALSAKSGSVGHQLRPVAISMRVRQCPLPHDPSRQSTTATNECIHPPVRFIVEFVYLSCFSSDNLRACCVSVTYGVRAGLHMGVGGIPFHGNDATRELMQSTLFHHFIAEKQKILDIARQTSSVRHSLLERAQKQRQSHPGT